MNKSSVFEGSLLAVQAELQLACSFPRGFKKIARRCIFRCLPFVSWRNILGRSLRRAKIWAGRMYFSEVPEPFHSQYGQDIVAAALLKKSENITYLDIGAHDGKSYSNTFVFEQYGYRGICVEPMPITFNELIRNRNAKCVCCAVGERDGETVEFVSVIGQGSMLSHVVSAADASEKKQRVAEVVHSGLARTEVIDVQVKTVATLLKESGFEQIDFVSIDTEGQEMQVLRHCPLKDMGVKVLTIEANADDSLECVLHMARQGYRMHAALGDDLIFVSSSQLKDQ